MLIAASTSILYHQMVLSITVENVIWIYVTRATTYSALFGTYVSFLTYIRNLVDMRNSYWKIFNVTVYGITGLAILYEWIGPFFEKGFYIDENLMIHQNYYQDRQMQTTYICISFVFPTLAFLFLYHHNSYEIETGMLDHHAFDAYIQDMQEKNFSMIFLSFPELTREKLEKMSSKLFKKADYQILFEGVEDEKDEQQCIGMEAMYLQGYKYSKPIPISQLENFLVK